jgi:hypothetical protein
LANGSGIPFPACFVQIAIGEIEIERDFNASVDALNDRISTIHLLVSSRDTRQEQVHSRSQCALESVTFQSIDYPKAILSDNLRGHRVQFLLFGLVSIGILFPRAFPWVAAAIAIYWGFHSGFVDRKRKRTRNVPSEKHRLECVGNAADLSIIRDLHTEFIEPFVLESSAIEQTGSPWFNSTRSNLPILLTIFASLIAMRLAGLSAVASTSILLFANICALYAARLGYPISFRVAPGCLDILTSTPFSRELRLYKRIPLREAAIVARLDGDYVDITVAPNIEERILLAGVQQREAREFVRAIFLAAISPYESPPLPSDRLVG